MSEMKPAASGIPAPTDTLQSQPTYRGKEPGDDVTRGQHAGHAPFGSGASVDG